jgi:hypothetical protein
VPTLAARDRVHQPRATLARDAGPKTGGLPNSLQLLELKFPAVADMAEHLQRKLNLEENPAQALKVWLRLVSDPRMDLVWKELYKKKRTRDSKLTGNFLHPGRVRNETIASVLEQRISKIREKGDSVSEQDAGLVKELEFEVRLLKKARNKPADPRWSEQDSAVQSFFYHAYHAALNGKPIFLSDLKTQTAKLRDVAATLRNLAEIEASLGLRSEARKLREVADYCDGQADNILPDRNPDGSKFIAGVDDPWIVTRRSGDFGIRKFLADLLITAQRLFGNPLWGTLATAANVALGRKDITRSKVREMLRP